MYPFSEKRDSLSIYILLQYQESVCGAFEKVDVHCKCLQGFTGFFSAILREKGFKNHRETPYFVHVVEKPCNIYRLEGNHVVIIGISLQFVNITGFPYS